jgi:hypothetical protein
VSIRLQFTTPERKTIRNAREKATRAGEIIFNGVVSDRDLLVVKVVR